MRTPDPRTGVLSTTARALFFPPSGTMRRRILLYLAVAVGTLATLAVLLAVDEHREEDARSRLEQKATVNLVRTDLDRLFGGSRGIVTALGFRENDAEICGSLLALKSSFPEFFNIGMFDVAPGEGTAVVVCGVQLAPGTRFPLLPDEILLLDNMKSIGEITLAPVRGNLVNGRPVMPFAQFVRSFPGGTRRFFSASVDLAWLRKEIDKNTIPPGAVLLVIDRKGTVVARNPHTEEFAPGKPAPAFERTLTTKGDFDAELIGEGGITRYYALSRVDSADGLIVILKIRSSEIFRRSRERLIMHLSGLLLVSGIVFAAAWSSSGRYVAQPLSRLTTVAHNLASGNLAERTGLVYEGEFGQLARTFDLMAASLQHEKNRVEEMLTDLRALTARLDSVAEEERTRIAREIHDELGQQLTSMQFELDRLIRKLSETPDAPQLRRLTSMVDAAIAEVRKIATELRPPALEYGGLAGAVEWYAEEFTSKTGIRCEVTVAEDLDVSGEPAICLFRIFQESLTNVARHSQATKVRVELLEADSRITLLVVDNGIGIKPKPPGGRRTLGVLGMGERARIAGGDFEIANAPEGGAIVRARIPKSPQA